MKQKNKWHSLMFLLVLVLCISLLQDKVFAEVMGAMSLDSSESVTLKTVDVFLCMGQSNMSGRAQTCATKYNGLTGNTIVTNYGRPPELEEGYAWEFRAISDPTRLYPLAEPFGYAELNEDGIYDTAVSGGMIVSFAETYHNITGRNAVYVYASKGGTTIEEWAPNGKLYMDAVSRLDSCLSYLSGAGYTVDQISTLWLQGENDAIAGTTEKTYITALQIIVDDLTVNHGIDYVYLCMIGSEQDNIDSYDTIKDAQIKACKYVERLVMACTILENYDSYHIDRWHYYQIAYNQVGVDFATNVANHIMTGELPRMYCPHTGEMYNPAIDISECTVTLSASSYIYSGTAKKPAVTVTDRGSTLIEGSDYIVSYVNNINAGTARVIVTGINQYAGTVEKTFIINKASQNVTASINKSELKVGDTAAITTEAKGAVSYSSNNTNVATVNGDGVVIGAGAGSAMITVMAAATDNYKAASKTLTVKVSIIQKELSSCTITLSQSSYIYDGTAKKPAVQVMDGERVLAEGVDYTVTYSANTDVGTASVTVNGKGQYIGTAKKTFIISLLTPVLSGVANVRDGVTIKWEKVAGAKGYFVYRKSGSGNWKKIGTISSGNTVSYTDNTAASGTTYTYTVRAYSGSTISGYDKTGQSVRYLATPALSGAINGVSGVTVKWEKVTGAEGYYVYRKSGSGNWKKIGSVNSGSTVSYSDKTASSGTTYTYTVRAYSNSTMSGYDATGKSIKYLAKPNLSGAINGVSGVTVKWEKVTGAEGYYVYRKSGSGNWKKIGSVSSGSTVSYSDKTASSGTTYTYTVRAYSNSTMSGYDATGKSVKYLVKPTLSNVINAKSGITVKWGKVTGAVGYYVYRKTSGSSWKKIGTVTGGSTVSYTDTTAISGTTYVYTVRAYSGSTMSGYDATGKSAKRLTQPTLSGTVNSKTGITAKWGKVTGASGYYVYRKTGNGNWQKVATVSNSNTSYLDKTVQSGTTYTYTVRAYSGNSVSSYDNTGKSAKH